MSVAGSVYPLPNALALMARDWMRRAGYELAWRHQIQATDFVFGDESQEQRVLLAAACDVVDLLAQSPDGRQALRDLGFEPVLQNIEGE